MTAARQFIAVGVLALAALLPDQAPVRAAPDAPAMPAFTHAHPAAWLNSPPLTLEQLRGSVVLVDVWTFDCWACYDSFPWLHALEKKFAPLGLKLIGVHSPEYEHEKVRARLLAKLKEFGIRYPVMMDNDLSYWVALHNVYWPAFYLLDKQGKVRGLWVGTTLAGDDNATDIEAQINALLAE